MNTHYQKYKKQIITTTKKYLREHQEYRLLHCSKQRAKRYNLEFNLVIDDIVIPEYCPYLNIKLTNIFGSGRVQTNASLDRIDSSKGYVKGNIEVISDLANRMKQEATKDQLVSFAKGILQKYNY